MTRLDCSTDMVVLVSIDISKARNDVLVELPDGTRRRFKVANKKDDYERLSAFLKSLGHRCVVGFEATGNYHRPLAYYLQHEGFQLRLVSSLAVARTREAIYNSWDKNDPKDAQVILHMLKTKMTQIYHDPLVNGLNDIQELSLTYYQVSLHKTRVQHSILTHFLPLYFPEAQKYFCCSRAEWFSELLMRFPNPASVLKYSKDEFVSTAWPEVGRKVNKGNWLVDFYETARESIGLPVSEESEAIEMFRTVLREHNRLCRLRKALEARPKRCLADYPHYKRLQTIPGIGPIVALIILAGAGDLRRFSHHRKFLKFCGFDLSAQQSGAFRGTTKLSKRGNARLRYAFWIAGTVAIRMPENTFRKKYDRYVQADPSNSDLKRKAFTAVAVKMARVAYALIKHGTDYRCYYESSVPSGRIPSPWAVEATVTS
jgi:transposase